MALPEARTAAINQFADSANVRSVLGVGVTVFWNANETWLWFVHVC